MISYFLIHLILKFYVTKKAQNSHPALFPFPYFIFLVCYITMFTILFGTTITFLGVLPSSHLMEVS